MKITVTKEGALKALNILRVGGDPDDPDVQAVVRKLEQAAGANPHRVLSGDELEAVLVALHEWAANSKGILSRLHPAIQARHARPDSALELVKAAIPKLHTMKVLQQQREANGG